MIGSRACLCGFLFALAACGSESAATPTDGDAGTSSTATAADSGSETDDSETPPTSTTVDGCGGPPSTTGGGDPTPLTTAADTGLDGEPCVLAETLQDVPEQCPPVRYRREECGPETWIEDEAALECALTVLRERIPGRVEFEDHSYGIPTLYRRTVISLGDGAALSEYFYSSGACNVFAPTEHVRLKPPGYFVDCLAMADPGERFECAWLYDESTLLECTEGSEECFNV
ncbi:hypothetical protein [Nannocystis punicea]|uniref:Lipoprotein n=1 Tax=Nannocystis punicea TaxID=2995304 RepID=A0ABY7GSE8_9BACT|nr:hypothetical protein [Nannocystis poenicansa]WAS89843.1 hypothetical protein O0S08_26930 [Nannocystis poenicansa]